MNWELKEREWLDWDAPWEEEPFEEEEYRSFMEKRLSTPLAPNAFRYSFQIVTYDESQTHVGWVNAYFIDKNYHYTENSGEMAIGISIPPLSARRKGYATEAWKLYIQYALAHGVKELYTQTWSGNERVIGLMKKMGFELVYKKEGFRQVRGKLYDGLTFKLNKEKFEEKWK